MDEGLSFNQPKLNPSTYVYPNPVVFWLSHWECFGLIFIAVLLTTQVNFQNLSRIELHAQPLG